MSRFQLWSRDTYGQGSILMTSSDLIEIMKRAKTEVTNANVNNALTSDDRERNWEMYFPIISSSDKKANKSKIFLYGGRGALNKDLFYEVDKSDSSVKEISLEDIKSPSISIYLGNISSSRKEEKDWYAIDRRRKIINSLDNDDLNDKTMLFVKVVK